MGRVELACGLGVVLIWIHPEMVRSQSTAWETWELSGVIWCGDPEVWSVDSTTVTLPFYRRMLRSQPLLWGVQQAHLSMSMPQRLGKLWLFGNRL